MKNKPPSTPIIMKPAEFNGNVTINKRMLHFHLHKDSEFHVYTGEYFSFKETNDPSKGSTRMLSLYQIPYPYELLPNAQYMFTINKTSLFHAEGFLYDPNYGLAGDNLETGILNSLKTRRDYRKAVKTDSNGKVVPMLKREIREATYLQDLRDHTGNDDLLLSYEKDGKTSGYSYDSQKAIQTQREYSWGNTITGDSMFIDIGERMIIQGNPFPIVYAEGPCVPYITVGVVWESKAYKSRGATVEREFYEGLLFARIEEYSLVRSNGNER